MISYFSSIKSKHCIQIGAERLLEIVKSEELKQKAEVILQQIEVGNIENANNIKSTLPVVVLSQLYDNGQPRSKNGGSPTGLVMIDYDECETIDDARAMMQTIKEKYISDMLVQDTIVACHFSPRMHGVHIWFRWIDGCKSVAECCERLASWLEMPNYDKSCKDNSRCSFLVPYSYFEIINLDGIEHTEPFAEIQRRCESNSQSSPTPAVKKTVSSIDTTSTSYPLEYDGIPYTDIIQQLTLVCAPSAKIDNDGNVLEGARNNTWFKVACLVRYICDNNADWILNFAPQWARDMDNDGCAVLAETTNQACKRSMSYNMPKSLEKILKQLKGEDASLVAESNGTITEDMQEKCLEEYKDIEDSKMRFLQFPSVMPPIFNEFCSGVKQEWKAAVVFTLLPTLGTLMSKLRAKYLDERYHSPSFQTVIEAKMSSGKQNFSDIADFVLQPVTLKDLEGNTQLNIYNQELVKANNAKSIASPPDVCVRKMIGKFTEAGLNSVLDTSKGLHIWSGVSEIDEVANVWKELSYILRLAYDNALYGRTLQSAKQFRGERRLYLNTFICGTPRAIERVYQDPEDGLVSRTMFFKLIVETPGIPLNKVTNKQKQSIASLCKKIHDKYCINDANEIALEQEINLRYVCNHMKKWLDKKNKEATLCGSEALERFRRRDACNGFRAAMVAHAIYLVKNGKVGDKEKKIVCSFAEWVAEYSLMMHDYKFGTKMNEILEEDDINVPKKNVSVLTQLPDVFSLAEAYRLFRNKSASSVRSMLARLINNGYLVSEERGMYKKK